MGIMKAGLDGSNKCLFAVIHIAVFSFISTTLLYNTASAQPSQIIVVQGDTVNLAMDTVVRNKLVKLDLAKFKGMTVGEMLKNDTVKLYTKYFFTEEPPFKLHSLYLEYARGLYLKLYFRELKYQPRYREANEFSFEKILLETISDILLDSRFFEENVVKRYGGGD